jgi:phasin
MAAKQGSDAGGEVTQNLRQTAEKTLTQARSAVDQYMREAQRLQGTVDASLEAGRAGIRDINRKAIGYAEANVNAAFDFAQALVKAKDPTEIVALQQSFLKQQMDKMTEQMREIGSVVQSTASDATAAARPKR